jgi:hypothetical protein
MSWFERWWEPALSKSRKGPGTLKVFFQGRFGHPPAGGRPLFPMEAPPPSKFEGWGRSRARVLPTQVRNINIRDDDSTSPVFLGAYMTASD